VSRRVSDLLVCLLTIGALALSGCGDDTTPVDSSATADAGAGPDDTGSTSSDTGTSTDTAGPADTGPDDVGALDVAAEDTGATNDCPGGPGCACTGNSECDQGLCIDVGLAKQCAKKCTDTCETGFTCAIVNTGGSDTATFCVPQWDRLCAPCKATADCKTLGFDDNVCVDRGSSGAFCGVVCSDDKGCPKDYACKAAKSVDGAATKQCVPVDDKGADAMCTCNEWATAKKASTACAIEHKNDKGEIIASCPGTRACDQAGLSACVGGSPAGETCNGADDDCDGKTDEGTCDDNNACTADGCDPKADGGKGACVHNKIDGPCDADGSVCTEADKCIAGVCTPGKSKTCDDGNACTKDACDAAKGCTATDADGDNCDDDNPCSIGDTCKAGSCVSGKAKACTSTDACLTAKCDLKNGKCKYTDKPSGSACDDGSSCTTGDACKAGTCIGKAKSCDDGNACTDDACEAAKGCAYTNNNGPCEDGSKCTGGDLCKAGKCVAGAPKSCEDGNPCTKRSCDPDTGTCQTKKLAVACDDGSKCTVKDVCDGGFCTGKAVDCDDKNPCTTDSCKAATGCTHAANKLPCNDNSKCTTSDTCSNGTCVGLAVQLTVTCNDGNPCTTPGCDPAKGCLQKANTAVCTDGNVCTVGDRCKDKACVAGANTCACQKTADCASKEDGDLCNGTLFCDTSKAPFTCKLNPNTVVKCAPHANVCRRNICVATTGKCLVKARPDGTGCDADGSVCTSKDACKSGSCTAGKKLACNDGKVCTDDSCHATKGCVFANNKVPCDADGSVCTVADSCKSGLCLTGPKRDCDDKNGCTDDSCDPKKGCLHAANVASCDDGNPCTDKDKCAAKACKGIGLDCNDGNACTADSCSKTSGCAHKAVNKSCDDGNACTTSDVCAGLPGGKWGCKGGKPKVCDDGNVCTLDSCDKTKGCVAKVETTKKHVCYSGAKGTDGKGTCRKGTRICKPDGTFAACIGEVVPAKKEACDGKDDDCDGATDEGCAAASASVGFGNSKMNASGGKYAVRAWTGGSAAVNASAGSKHTARWGWYRWLRARLQ